MTTFFRLLDVEDKAEALRAAVAGATPDRTFEVASEAFLRVAKAAFAYWVSPSLLGLFERLPSLVKAGHEAWAGLQTSDDYRWLRLWWEVPQATHGRERQSAAGGNWVPLAKGGKFRAYHADVYLVVDWHENGRRLKEWKVDQLRQGLITANNSKCWNETKYFRPGLTWTARTQSGFALRVLPNGCIMGKKGPGLLTAENDDETLLALLALGNSSVFRSLVELQTTFGSYEVGTIQSVPCPNLSRSDARELAQLAERAWAAVVAADSELETSHFFSGSLSRGRKDAATEEAAIQAEIEQAACRVYGVSSADTFQIGKWAAATSDEDAEGSERDEEDVQEIADDTVGDEHAILSFHAGVAFGRFSSEQVAEAPRTPFEALPPVSPAMHGARPVAVLVDDQGHNDDVAHRVHEAAVRSGGDAARFEEEWIRAWLAREFFPLHIKMYSKSRRKAPIYWQLATPSASYSVWLYIHAFSKDTLFRVQNDYAAPKLAHEERRLESLTSELRDGATATQRKELAAQENVVEELRAFLEEVKRVTPLWNPDLDDGVIINFAPLWRLVPHHKPWQKELKATWDTLCEGKYDWAHLAMRLWPERVVPKCARDRSLAIAHDLEDVFWVEGSNGKWTARKTPTRPVEELVGERTSSAVKAALKSLLEAPVAQGGSGRGRGGRRRAAASADEGGGSR